MEPLRNKLLAWRKGLHARLFLLMALLTSALAISVAFFIISGFKRSIESYTKELAFGTVRGVAADIRRSDPELKFRRETSELLASWSNPESVRQIDILMTAKVDGDDHVEVWATSRGRPEGVAKNDAEILRMMGRRM